VVRYWHPDEFKQLERAAYGLGFESVAAGPLVRSSYHADESAREVAERRRAA
jgi:lipoyl synthase